jgi:site-specific DNA-cytosine methylase
MIPVKCAVPNVAYALCAGNQRLDPTQETSITYKRAVRRLTPTECERLQGFPDSYTQVPYNGKPAADTPRYIALGNSWAVPVARWIGERIELVNRFTVRRREHRSS